MVTNFAFSPTMKAGAEEALLAATRRRPEDSCDDTESFNEEECLFAEGNDLDSEDDEWHQGPFAYHSRRRARQSTSHKPVHQHHDRDISDDLNALRISGHVYQMRRLNSDVRPECGLFSSYDERSSARQFEDASPDVNKPRMQRTRRAKKSSLSVRESLLAEAWERKRGLMLSEEMASFKERALVGRSSSDCGKRVKENVQGLCHELRRSDMRSLTDDDFDELRGCIDLGFRFDQSAIPDLCETLPALEVYCAVTQSLQESPIFNSPVRQSPTRCSSPSPTASWRVASPGDDPKDVKDRLRHWAQAVACDARLCY